MHAGCHNQAAVVMYTVQLPPLNQCCQYFAAGAATAATAAAAAAAAAAATAAAAAAL